MLTLAEFWEHQNSELLEKQIIEISNNELKNHLLNFVLIGIVLNSVRLSQKPEIISKELLFFVTQVNQDWEKWKSPIKHLFGLLGTVSASKRIINTLLENHTTESEEAALQLLQLVPEAQSMDIYKVFLDHPNLYDYATQKLMSRGNETIQLIFDEVIQSEKNNDYPHFSRLERMFDMLLAIGTPAKISLLDYLETKFIGASGISFFSHYYWKKLIPPPHKLKTNPTLENLSAHFLYVGRLKKMFRYRTCDEPYSLLSHKKLFQLIINTFSQFKGDDTLFYLREILYSISDHELQSCVVYAINKIELALSRLVIQLIAIDPMISDDARNTAKLILNPEPQEIDIETVLLYQIDETFIRTIRFQFEWGIENEKQVKSLPLKAFIQLYGGMRWELKERLLRITMSATAANDFVEKIAAFLKDENVLTRETTAEILGRIAKNNAKAINCLLHSLVEEKDAHNKWMIIWALGQIGDKSIINDLEPYLHDQTKTTYGNLCDISALAIKSILGDSI